MHNQRLRARNALSMAFEADHGRYFLSTKLANSGWRLMNAATYEQRGTIRQHR